MGLRRRLTQWLIYALILGVYLYFLEPLVTLWLGATLWATVISVFLGLCASEISSKILTRRMED